MTETAVDRIVMLGVDGGCASTPSPRSARGPRFGHCTPLPRFPAAHLAEAQAVADEIGYAGQVVTPLDSTSSCSESRGEHRP